ncbi:hypothetical protein [Pontibacter sp. JAM-7]|uniref:hypothetical protein n=1 Tax=Pontibacter sp. JAM-7 TaxID=3366581 RepID=UPI003AF7A9DF
MFAHSPSTLQRLSLVDLPVSTTLFARSLKERQSFACNAAKSISITTLFVVLNAAKATRGSPSNVSTTKQQKNPLPWGKRLLSVHQGRVSSFNECNANGAGDES